MSDNAAPYSAAHVANFFLDKAAEEERQVDNLKLQKLVYIAYGWCLAVLDMRLFDERIEAWTHGPVIPSLYHEFKHFRWRPIDEFSVNIDWDGKDFVEPRISPEDEEVTLVLGKVWDVYKRFDGWALRKKTHEPGTPWTMTRETGGRNAQIRDDLIEEHFTQRIRQYLNVAHRTAGS